MIILAFGTESQYRRKKTKSIYIISLSLSLSSPFASRSRLLVHLSCQALCLLPVEEKRRRKGTSEGEEERVCQLDTGGVAASSTHLHNEDCTWISVERWMGKIHLHVRRYACGIDALSRPLCFKWMRMKGRDKG
jgi:hypothetical protein